MKCTAQVKKAISNSGVCNEPWSKFMRILLIKGNITVLDTFCVVCHDQYRILTDNDLYKRTAPRELSISGVAASSVDNCSPTCCVGRLFLSCEKANLRHSPHEFCRIAFVSPLRNVPKVAVHLINDHSACHFSSDLHGFSS